MEGSSKGLRTFKIEETFAEVLSEETENEVFAGRKEYVDPLENFFSSSKALHRTLNQEFDRVYEFENAVLNFFEFFKKNSVDERKAQGGA